MVVCDDRKPNVEGVSEQFRSAYDRYRSSASLPASSADAKDADGELGRDEPPHTTVNFRRCWAIDYIWYSSSNLVSSRVAKIPSEEELRSEEGPPGWINRLAMLDSYSKLGRLPSGLQGNHNGIPNSRFGSDHVPIMAELEFLRPNEQQQ